MLLPFRQPFRNVDLRPYIEVASRAPAEAGQTRFQLPEGIDADKVEASFKKGVLTVTLPKKPEAQKPEKKIDVKAS